MAFNPQAFYPASYQPMVYPPQMQSGQQMMTPPTIHAEIIQVDGEQNAAQYPVAAGASQMMIARDDSAIFVKTVAQNGNSYTLDVFTKRPPAPPAPKFEPGDYVRKDELEALISAMLKKGEDHEPV